MPIPPQPERVFPLSGGSAPRPTLRPPRLASVGAAPTGVVMGQQAFLRAWAARRAQLTQRSLDRTGLRGPT